jgi:hypothetical protein
MIILTALSDSHKELVDLKNWFWMKFHSESFHSIFQIVFDLKYQLVCFMFLLDFQASTRQEVAALYKV